MVITMASYALQTPPRVAHAKPPGPMFYLIWFDFQSLEAFWVIENVILIRVLRAGEAFDD